MFTALRPLSEFDLVWKQLPGLPRQRGRLVGPRLPQPEQQVARHLEQPGQRPAVAGPDRTTPSATREGPSGEFLDVFAFAKFNVGEAPVNVKLGQTTVYWGESLLLGGAIHGISYSQNPIDLWKG